MLVSVILYFLHNFINFKVVSEAKGSPPDTQICLTFFKIEKSSLQ